MNNEIRIPLDHPQTDKIDKTICRLLMSGWLTDDEIGTLIKRRTELRRADRMIARRIFDRPLPRTELRPYFHDDWKRPMSGAFGHDPVEVVAGWVWRLGEYADRLAAKYGWAVAA